MQTQVTQDTLTCQPLCSSERCLLLVAIAFSANLRAASVAGLLLEVPMLDGWWWQQWSVGEERLTGRCSGSSGALHFDWAITLGEARTSLQEGGHRPTQHYLSCLALG